jgi:ABC-type oligopeptide transport system ATPase subunit
VPSLTPNAARLTGVIHLHTRHLTKVFESGLAAPPATVKAIDGIDLDVCKGDGGHRRRAGSGKSLGAVTVRLVEPSGGEIG